MSAGDSTNLDDRSAPEMVIQPCKCQSEVSSGLWGPHVYLVRLEISQILLHRLEPIYVMIAGITIKKEEEEEDEGEGVTSYTSNGETIQSGHHDFVF
ncbi:uncharacterized protein IL334_003568 [Kwoniella shivajii]|uniref:Uncharacterized protein n=1 Tax=Kwoniella shivajii TaxID=564305 RepID=A0ABZ1CXY4_9TREE|nr:hypothetical protein IL334_003568 [Kwoniella shivajii]